MDASSVDALAEAEALIRGGKLKEAERLLAEAASSPDADFETCAMHARVLMRLDRDGDALDAARRTLERFPRAYRARVLLAQTLIKLDAPQEAREVLAEAREAHRTKPMFQAMLATAALLNADTAEALSAIDRAAAAKPDEAEYQLRRAILLAADGRMDEADDIRRSIEDGVTRMLKLYRDWIFALSRAGHDALALKLAEDACVMAPSQAVPWLWRGEMLIGLERYDEALKSLERCTRSNEPMGEQEQFNLARARSRALRQTQGHDAAIDACKQALALKPEDQSTLRDLYVLHLQTDDDEAMREYGRMLERAGAKKLPATLALGLKELKGRKPPPTIMDARARWAWEIADKSKWSAEAWQEALHWGHNADDLLRAWWLNASPRAGEIGALIDREADNALTRLPREVPCLCVGTHMGPLAAAVHFLETCGRPFRGFGFAGPDPVVDGKPPMRISSRGNRALRELMAEIAKGTLIGFAAESRDADNGIELDFLGRRIAISTMVPRLIWKLKPRSMWWHALWKEPDERGGGERVRIELDMLPDPEEGEPLEPWCRRWLDAYLERVARIMQGDPRNLNLRHGIWRNAEKG
ncbi:MAG: tetratricopeptide repeat protein [Alphaproteobacteria bacterium]|nr:tetratricopeptide repeat protein [Alphaproteobacteria bacterium]